MKWRITLASMNRLRSVVVSAFLATMLAVAGFTYLQLGGRLPVFSSEGYRITATLTDAQNLLAGSSVREAGVDVGTVHSIGFEPGKVTAVLRIDQDSKPLHEGATVRLRFKSLIEETYVEVVDGTGKALPGGAALPAAAQLPAVRFEDLLNSLDAPTQRALGSLIRRLDPSTRGRAGDLSTLLAGLGGIGRDGAGTLDILAAQTDDLRGLTAETAELLALLDEGQGRLARVVDAAERVSGATAAQADDLEAAVKALPGVLDRAKAAAGPLRSLTGALTPLAPPLRAAAPDLSAALTQLGPATTELRGLLPPLGAVLDQAPATLTRTPPVATALRAAIPPLCGAFGDLDPMLAYLAPYGRDAAAGVANFADALSPARHTWRIGLIVNGQSPEGLTSGGTNAYPAPGASTQPAAFSGAVPQVAEQPVC